MFISDIVNEKTIRKDIRYFLEKNYPLIVLQGWNKKKVLQNCKSGLNTGIIHYSRNLYNFGVILGS